MPFDAKYVILKLSLQIEKSIDDLNKLNLEIR